MGILLAALIYAIMFAISLAFVILIMPFEGALIRLRANYLPKAVTLDNVLQDGRDEETPRDFVMQSISWRHRRSTGKIGPVVGGVFPMIARTKRLEGWEGLWKGVTPLIAETGVTLLISSMLLAPLHPQRSPYSSVPGGPGNFPFLLNFLTLTLVAVVMLPFQVVVARTVVHPRPLIWARPRDALLEVLSYAEYRQPWRLYTVPGLAIAVLLRIVWMGLLSAIVRQLTVPALGGLAPPQPAGPDQDHYDGPHSGMLEINPLGLTVYILWNVASVALLAPLDCITVRLATQRPMHQQPLHLTFASDPQRQAPAPYSHQASVSGGARQDTQAPRSSFTIDDEADEREEQPAVQHAADKNPSSEEQQPLKADDEAAENEAAGDVAAEAPEGADLGKAAAQDAGARTAPEPTDQVPPGSEDAQPQRTEPGFTPFTPGPQRVPIEPVIALRPCDDPESPEEQDLAFGAPAVERYTGIVDCLMKMRNEEGLESLMRGAWVTLLSVLLGNFA